MRVLIGCEFSGVVRRAFARLGHDAWSCDYLPAEDGSNQHLLGDVRDYLDLGWDLLAVFHPPCTRLCNSGVRWLSAPPRGRSLEEMWEELRAGAKLFSDLLSCKIKKKCLENPIMHRHARALIANLPKPQIIQPHHFGHPEFKATGLYLDGLPKLVATNQLELPKHGTAEWRQWHRVWRMPPGAGRGKERSRFFPPVADAMAQQWGGVAA